MAIFYRSDKWAHIRHSCLWIFIVYSFDFRHARVYKVVSKYNFNLHFYDNQECYWYSYMLISHLHISFYCFVTITIIIDLHFRIKFIFLFLRISYMHIMHFDQIYLPCLFSSSTYILPPSLPISCAVFKATESTQWYSYVHCFVFIYCNMCCLPGIISLNKTDSLSFLAVINS